jgi:hypothetical protein
MLRAVQAVDFRHLCGIGSGWCGLQTHRRTCGDRSKDGLSGQAGRRYGAI